MAAEKIVCVILISFRLSQISCFTLSLKCFPFVPNNCPNVAIWTSASVPPPTKGRSSPTNSPLFLLLPSSYRPLHGSIYSFPLVRYSCLLSAGILASTSVSEGIFQMYPWIEMYSTSTYSSDICSLLID